MRDSEATLRYPDGSGQDLAAFIGASPAGSVVELAPGRYEGPLRIDKPVRVRGAGDLTRISCRSASRVVDVDLPDPSGEVMLESLLLEEGDADSGAGIRLVSGKLFLHNVHIQRCRARGGGGAIHVQGGALEAHVLRVNDVQGDRGGAIWVQGEGKIRARDCEITGSEARQGGALAVQGAAQVALEAVTVKKARATTPGGGQALFVSGGPGLRPSLAMRRVRLEDAPLGIPLFVDPVHPGDVSLTGCDMPRMVASVVGVVDGGENHWR